MKKIRNKKQLNRELEKLRDEQSRLEGQMKESWKKIKKSFQPLQAVKNLLRCGIT